MGRPMCAFAYRKRREITLRCRNQNGETNYCCYQYYCPQTGQYENADERRTCRLLNKEEIAIVTLKGEENNGKNERQMADGVQNVHAADEKNGAGKPVRRKLFGK